MNTEVRPIPLILKEEFLRRKSKNQNYSMRAFAKSLGLSSSFVSKLLNGKKTISLERTSEIMQKMNLHPIALDQLSAHMTEDAVKYEFDDIDYETFQMISDWEHFAILELITLKNLDQKIESLAKRLNISNEKATQAIERLLKLGLLAKDKKGKITSTNKNLSTRNQKIPTSANTEHERQVLQKAIQALDDVSSDERSQSSMTMAIPAHRLSEAREKIKKFQRELTQFLQRPGDRDSVYQLSISFFPLTENSKINKNDKTHLKENL